MFYHFEFFSRRKVPDCVEVAVREILELLLFDPHRQSFDLSLLPASTTAAAVQQFFGLANLRLENGAVGNSVLDHADWLQLLLLHWSLTVKTCFCVLLRLLSFATT